MKNIKKFASKDEYVNGKSLYSFNFNAMKINVFGEFKEGEELTVFDALARKFLASINANLVKNIIAVNFITDSSTVMIEASKKIPLEDLEDLTFYNFKVDQILASTSKENLWLSPHNNKKVWDKTEKPKLSGRDLHF